MMGMDKRKRIIFFTVIVPIIALFCHFPVVKAEELPASTVHLRILETTDLHGNMLDYDYRKKRETIEFGLARTATLIKKARNEVQNSLLFDNGDLLVGNALGEYAVKKYKENPKYFFHPVYKIMNSLHYDAATLGNHEFNYGLDFLLDSIKGAKFPYVNANVYVDDHNDVEVDDINFFNPYVILNKQVVDTNGQTHNIKVGVIGLLTPIFYAWDIEHVRGMAKVKSLVQTAEHFVPIMKQKGADVIVVLAHSGIGADKRLKDQEGNNLFNLSKVKGIDAILFGHSHSVFPGRDDLKNRPGINNEKGTINGVAAVQAGFWGNHLGIIDLNLQHINGEWKVMDSQSEVQSIFRIINGKKKPNVNPDPEIHALMEESHLNTLMYLEESNLGFPLSP
ncbi:metallophosphoesterase [Bacillus sp. 31A1R]|uniref:Metallophosphoesterase n=1 Tax=Robertmurraya mangrovi TaxID=3098077 RepID=A0ABU5IZF0_9BACI|nr:metallophosphoesterase [Bacillus sp. 31A1R]MDZ5472512.1 metallophosphoesterase [Bacillus sp. 31A1R]